MATDPICGMTVEPATAAGRFEYEGVPYYFCSTHCLDRFRAAPSQYVEKATDAGVPQPTAGRRSLPMMPSMADQPTQGSEMDPVCGMTVQPATAAGAHLYKDKTYYFCCQGCLEKFRADPARYLTAMTAPVISTAGPRGIAAAHGGGISIEREDLRRH